MSRGGDWDVEVPGPDYLPHTTGVFLWCNKEVGLVGMKNFENPPNIHTHHASC